MLRIYFLSVIFCTVSIFAAPIKAQKIETAFSALSEVRLSGAGLLLPEDRIPAELNDVLGKLVVRFGTGKFRQGASEVIVWTGTDYRQSNAARIFKQFVDDLQSGGWNYAAGEKNAKFTVFNLLNTSDRRLIIGFWTADEASLVIALTEMSPVNAVKNSFSNPVLSQSNRTVPATRKDSAKTLRVGAETDYINVMGGQMPAVPAFPALAKKAGYLRGYIRATDGAPIAGAKLGLKTAQMYDSYLAASAESDANGYYEIKIPAGSARFDYAGVSVAYGEGKAALALHPADGGLSESYPAATGAIENFVLLTYGIANAADVENSPRYRSNYYGGAVLIRYFIGGFGGMLAAGTEIEISLTPVGALIDGNRGDSFVIRKTVENSSLGEFFINNVPIGRYQIEVKYQGKTLKMQQKSPTNSVFGIAPKEARGAASLTFNPLSGDAKTTATLRGNWADLEIIVGQ